MNNKILEFNYKYAIAQRLEATPDRISLYWKGRVALYALLRAMNIKEDDEVIIPAFTCVVVPNAIIYLKAKPIYVDIDPITYNIDVEKLKIAITSRTKVIICQNTFGLSSNVEKICEIAATHHLYTIEDCTHGFGGYYHKKPNGTYCDAAFFSSQWNKPFSTGIGGFAIVNNMELLYSLQIVNSELEHTSLKDNLSLSILYFVRDKVLTNSRYWKMLKFYRWLSKYKLVQGSSSKVEIETTVMPSHYFKSMSKVQIKKGIKNIALLSDNLGLRKKNAIIYSHYLAEKHKKSVPFELFENHSFLKYPILVKNRDIVFEIAEKYHIPLGEWFCSPIHPVQKNWEYWNLQIEKFPIACQCAEEIVNLPTDTQNIDAVLNFIDAIEENIL